MSRPTGKRVSVRQLGGAFVGAALVSAGLLMAGLAAPSSARAFECIAGNCPVWCQTVPYGLTITSPDLGDGTTEAEVRRGMDDWTTVSCTDLQTNYTGRSNAVAGNGDGQSVIGWIESGWPHSSGAIGVTGPRWGGSCIREADMQMNGVNFTWTTSPGAGSRVNAYSIILHEGGHYYGLGHSSDRAAAMFASYSGGTSRLAADDQNGICTLYPGEGGGPVDCTTTGCPSGQECVSGSCRPVTGDGSVCSPCTSNADCNGGACLAYPPGNQGFCGAPCSSAADCPGSEYRCFPVGFSGNQCVRVVGGQATCQGATPTPTGCTTDSDCQATERCASGQCELRPTGGSELGAPCSDNAECNSGLCATTPMGQVCSQTCNGFDTMSCPAGFYCDGEANGTCGEGSCFPGSPGASPLGASCSTDTDCATLMCDRGTCASPCIPGGATSCEEGYTCQVGTIADCGACKMARDLGDDCQVNDDCASALCVVRDGDDQFCSELCSEDDPCPSGFACSPAGDVSVCTPPTGIRTPGRDDGCGCVAAGAPIVDGRGGPLWLVAAIFLWRRRSRRGRRM